MAPRPLPMGQKKKSAKYYALHPEKKAKKNATTHENNQKPERKRKMAESTKARREAVKRGTNVKGRDMAHTKNGIRPKSSSANRGSSTDSAGDRRTRGKKR